MKKAAADSSETLLRINKIICVTSQEIVMLIPQWEKQTSLKISKIAYLGVEGAFLV